MNRFFPSRLAALLLLALCCLLPACAKKEPEKQVEFGPKVNGKVTYKGEPVPYGVVLFYAHGKGVEPTTGQMAPAASANLSADGTYEVTNAPVGPVMVCVACDPDADVGSFTAPVGFHMGDGGGGMGGGPPMAGGGPPMAGGGPPMAGGGPPMAGGGPPMAGGGPPMAGGGPPMAGGGPPQLPKDLPRPPKPPNPAVDKLSDAQKKTLKEIHDRFGILGKSTLNHIIPKDGESLTYNIELK